MNTKLAAWIKFRDYVATDFLGGPKCLKAAWVINLQKAGTFPFVLFFMWYFNCFTATAWVYAALHGCYGFCWLLKDRVFPDPNWEKKVTIGGGIMMWVLVLGLYWIAPMIIVINHVEAPLWMLCFAITLCILGIVIMMVSDAQKYFMLQVKKGLITNGFFARIRHTNYLGEIMLYASFALLAYHWLPWLVLAWVWLAVFIPNMLAKEASLSRYPGWDEYKKRSGFLLPKLF